MARYAGPKNRLSRHIGLDLGFKTVGTKAHASLMRRLNMPPGMHGPKGRRKLSDYGQQLLEKQKVKWMYGLLERQFRQTFARAKKWKGNTGDKLLQFLESRLDNVLYRMGLTPTRSAARQLISHGQVLLNGRKVDIPSYQVRAGQVVTLAAKAMEIPAVKKMLSATDVKVPLWVERQGPAGKVVRLPERGDISEDINEQLIIEYYSR